MNKHVNPRSCGVSLVIILTPPLLVLLVVLIRYWPASAAQPSSPRQLPPLPAPAI